MAGNDSLVFRNSGFDLGVDDGKGTSAPQAIAASLFSPNTNGTFATTDNRFAYNQSNGDLFYAAHGELGGEVLFAHLVGAPHISRGDLIVEA